MKSLSNVVMELSSNAQEISDVDVKKMLDILSRQHHIFLAGKGRSGLVVQGFANRLGHLGFEASVVGELSSPRSKQDDTLILCSGSGETGSLLTIAKVAKERNLTIVLITTDTNSSLAQLSNVIVVIKGNTKTQIHSEHNTIQPMGTLFEQTTWLMFDAVVLELMEKYHIDENYMKQRHADFE